MTSASRIHRPAEIFGLPVEQVVSDPDSVMPDFYCPHLDGPCSKVSQHELIGDLPFGVCSVWHRARFSEQSIPHIICPHRLATEDVLADIAREFAPDSDATILEEIHLGAGTSDFVVVDYDRSREAIEDFCAVEVMAVSTTGTGQIIQALVDVLRGEFKERYQFGINYRQVLSRTIVQLCAKGKAFASWNKRTYWIIQDVLAQYLDENYDFAIPAGRYAADDPIVLLIYTLRKSRGNWTLQLSDRRSGNAEDFASLLYTSAFPSREKAERILMSHLRRHEND